MNTLVMKFGGTSVGGAQAFRRTSQLIIASGDRWPARVVVISAMTGVTDLLVQGAHAAVSAEVERLEEVIGELRRKHRIVISDLFPTGKESQLLQAGVDQDIDYYESLCNAVLVLGELTPRALDAMSSMGERLSVRLLVALLRQEGQSAKAINAAEIVVTDDNFQAAMPLMDETTAQTEMKLRPLLHEMIVPIITGFVGATRDGVTTTLGRGGSDYSAAILGQSLQASEVWIWTDVDGVMTADPRLVSGAKTIPMLSYREVAELAYYGAKVLHPKTIRPVIENLIPLRIKNTFNPDDPGTLIVSETPNGNGGVKAVTAIRDISLINVEGRGMMGVPGIAARTFGAVAHSRVSVLLISQASSEQSICFAVPAEFTDRVVADLDKEFAEEIKCRDIDKIWAQKPLSIVTAVGAGMRGTLGIAGRMFSALGDQGVNIIAIAQGSSECSISIVVDSPDTAAAEEAIHSLILKKRDS